MPTLTATYEIDDVDIFTQFADMVEADEDITVLARDNQAQSITFTVTIT